MDSLSSLHSSSRGALSAAFPDDKDLMQELVKVQEVEFYIWKQIYKKDVRDQLPLFKGFFTGIGNLLNNPLALLEPKKTPIVIGRLLVEEWEKNKERPWVKFKQLETASCVFCSVLNGNAAIHQIHNEQAIQSNRIVALQKKIKNCKSSPVSGERKRLTFSISHSISKNMCPIRQKDRGLYTIKAAKVEKAWDDVKNKKEELLKGEGEKIYNRVLQETKKEAEMELKNEYLLGLFVVGVVEVVALSYLGEKKDR